MLLSEYPEDKIKTLIGRPVDVTQEFINKRIDTLSWGAQSNIVDAGDILLITDVFTYNKQDKEMYGLYFISLRGNKVTSRQFWKHLELRDE